MFDRIAPRYDLANRLMSAGIDQFWRRRAVALLAPRSGERFLDLACGTGDCSHEILRRAPEAQVIGADFSREMLRRYDLPRAQADALALPVRAQSFDGAICAFGMRNVPDQARALAEVCRVLRPGGRLVVLEFFRKKSVTLHLARLVGGLVSGDRAAYDYLARSIESTATLAEFAERVAEAGFEGVAVRPLFPQGIATIVKGVRP